jgi:zinc finger protein
MSDIKEDDKPNGAAFDDFFESLGKKAENLTLKDSASKSKDSSAVIDGKELTTGTAAIADNSDDQKIVDEIESLCMNCHENVSYSRTSQDPDLH